MTNSPKSIPYAAEIHQLAHELNRDKEEVTRVYTIEVERLDRTARIKGFIPVLAKRHVRQSLRQPTNRRG